jgi:hypothetical protein
MAMTSRWKIALAAAVTAGLSTTAVIAASGGNADPAQATIPDDSVPASPDDEVSTPERSITVSGHGTVEVTPDIANIGAGVQATAPTADEVMDTVGTKSQALVDTLKAVGVAEEDIQTSGLSLYPNYGNDGRTIDGYSASVNVSITAHDVDRIGELLDAMQGFVGEELTLGGISFSYADPEAVLGEARAAAIENARTRAEQYATAADAEVGEIVRIVEATAGGAIPLPVVREAAAADTAQVAIEPGSQELTVDVSVVFAMG